METRYVYIQSEPNLWTVGFYDPSGKWHPESDQEHREDAANRAAWLNGSPSPMRETENSPEKNNGNRDS